MNRHLPPFAPAFRLASLSIFIALGLVQGAGATDIRVTKLLDSLDGSCNSDCSLREAVVLANAIPGKDRILLSQGEHDLSLATPKDGQYILDEDDNQHGDLDIQDELEIIGLSADRNAADGRFSVIGGGYENDRIFEVRPGAVLSFRNVALVGGWTSTSGGVIENHGTTTLRHSSVEGGVVGDVTGAVHGDGGVGGGIANYGELQIYHGRVANNFMHGSTNHKGRGGGIYNEGTLIARNVLFDYNNAITRFATTSGNVASGGAIYNIGIADIGRSAFTRNITNGPGAAIQNEGNGLLTLSNSTLSAKNLAHGEPTFGVISNGNRPIVTGNPELKLVHVTLTDSKAFGLVNQGKVLIRNSIITGNAAGDISEGQNCLNLGNTYDYRAVGLLLGNGAGNCTADLYAENADTFSLILRKLALNKGATPNHALQLQSLALDAGKGSCASFDQRGFARPRDGDGDGIAVCDLGAFEFHKPATQPEQH